MKKQLLFTFLLFLAWSFAIGQTNGREVMMQGFNWESHKSTYGWYNLVRDRSAELRTSGINAIWMPPPSDAASNEGYLPRELYKLTSKYGTQAQLQSMISTLHSNNIKVLADIVINHRVGTTGWGDFTNPSWGCWATTRDDEWTASCGNYDTGTPYSAARDLDHTNSTVRTDLKAWMNWLKNTIGYDGWRYDYVHGFGAGYIKEYNDATSPYFSVGELWDGDRQKVTNWINGTQGSSTAFDFPLKYALHDAVKGNYSRLNDGGKVPGLIGWLPDKSVTFIDNHDTGSTQNYDPFPGTHVMQGYAYILTHPGTPMVFWDHFYDWGLKSAIQALIKVRKDNGLHNKSTVSIQKADGSGYAAIIDGKVAMKIGSGSWAPGGTGWTLRTSGTNYAVWDKASTPPPATSFTVYFQKPSTWASATKIHHWGAQPAGSLSDPAWPGKDMTPDGGGWFKFTFNNISSTNLLFHDNAGRKTADLVRNKTGWYSNGVWYDTDPRQAATALKLHLYTSWASPTLHYWNVQPAGAAANTTWPGMRMQSEGGGWWVYTIPNASCTNLIFSNNGASQTANLSRCGEGWYMNGSWYSSKPATSGRLASNAGDDAAAGNPLPGQLRLDQNYPNPASSTTLIPFATPQKALVRLTLYNDLGVAVQVLVQGMVEAGQHAIPLNTTALPKGIYVYKLEYENQLLHKKMVIIH